MPHTRHMQGVPHDEDEGLQGFWAVVGDGCMDDGDLRKLVAIVSKCSHLCKGVGLAYGWPLGGVLGSSLGPILRAGRPRAHPLEDIEELGGGDLR